MRHNVPPNTIAKKLVMVLQLIFLSTFFDCEKRGQ